MGSCFVEESHYGGVALWEIALWASCIVGESYDAGELRCEEIAVRGICDEGFCAVG